MDEQKTVWVNLDPQKVDLTPIVSRCRQAGWRCITEDVGVDQKKACHMALKSDAIVSIGERWGDAQLAAIAGGNRIIVRYGAGLDNVDIPAATRHGIPVANLPGMNSPAVAEIALLHILNLGRRFSYSVSGVSRGIWPCSVPGNELDGKLLGTDRDVACLLEDLSDEAASCGAEFVTLFYGEDVSEEDAQKASEVFSLKCPDAEISLIRGGQPVYYYIISIE